MKTSILFSNGIKQLMLTPETQYEKEALKHFTGNEDVNVVTEAAEFCVGNISAHYSIIETRGNYLRPERDSDSIMFVLRPKQSVYPNPLEEKYKTLVKTIWWALGYGEFPKRKVGDGLYWWRRELRIKSELTDQELNFVNL